MSGVNVSTLGVNSLSQDTKKITNKSENIGQKNNKDFNLILNKAFNKKQESINSENQQVNYNKDKVQPLNKDMPEVDFKEKLKKYFKSLKDEKGLRDEDLMDPNGDLLQYLYSVLNIINTPETDKPLIDSNVIDLSKNEMDNISANNLKSNSKDIFIYLNELISKEFNSEDSKLSIKNIVPSEDFNDVLKKINDMLEEIYGEQVFGLNNNNEKKDSIYLLNKNLGSEGYVENSANSDFLQKLGNKEVKLNQAILNEKDNKSEESIIKPNEFLNKGISSSSEDNKEYFSNLKSSADNSSSFNKDEELLKSLSEDKENDKFSNKVNLNVMKFEGLKNNAVESTDTNIPIVRKEALQQDVIKWVKFMNTESMKELTLKVVPRELGEIVLKVSLDSGVMKAEILSNNKDTYKLLQNNIVEITNKLQNDSTKVQEVSVNIYSDNYMGKGHENLQENERESFNNKNKQNGKRSIEAIDAIEEEETSPLNEVLNKLA
ncbi:flagellar hook-length control protein FliK [Hathewaya massiliensis]|uniref:flagellar hook-length control protein FliK n=1 Tax=Hathewaya massiliensis TaxID=1964382 RepID=UPI00115BD17E|nr:flagellar hook-length control protein FliK [Hathewaya massiliensis]